MGAQKLAEISAKKAEGKAIFLEEQVSKEKKAKSLAAMAAKKAGIELLHEKYFNGIAEVVETKSKNGVDLDYARSTICIEDVMSKVEEALRTAEEDERNLAEE